MVDKPVKVSDAPMGLFKTENTVGWLVAADQ